MGRAAARGEEMSVLHSLWPSIFILQELKHVLPELFPYYTRIAYLIQVQDVLGWALSFSNLSIFSMNILPNIDPASKTCVFGNTLRAGEEQSVDLAIPFEKK